MIEIKNYDFSNFDDYRNLYGYEGSCAANETAPVEHILREWANAKNRYLARMFDDQLILERPIKYEAAEEDKIRLMDVFLNGNFANNFIRMFEKRYFEFFKTSYNKIYYSDTRNPQDVDMYDTFRICSSVLESSYLLLNNILPEYLAVRKMTLVNPDNPKDKVQIQTGEKALRVLSKVSKMIGLADVFEQFRIKLSQVTNVKDIHGVLCLSIHPLDYATASDNANGWSSCMSWQDSGCYRMGTVEMMNSPMVMCAYVKSEHTTMTFKNRDNYCQDHIWNSKKWRCWVICNEDLVVCGKNYPYESKAVEKLVINWVKELAETRLGWTYNNTVEDIYRYINASWPAGISDLTFNTNYMYNDFENNPSYSVVGAITKQESIFNKWRRVYNYSGEAECMCCGKLIDFDDSNIGDRANSLTCVDFVECAYCGRNVERSEAVEHCGDYYCPDCYDENFTYCEKCGQLIPNDEMRTVVLDRTRWDVCLQSSLCPDCFEKFEHMLQYSEVDGNYTVNLSELKDVHELFDLFDMAYTKMAYDRNDSAIKARWDEIFDSLKKEGEEKNEK